jgi:hypothetical protein
MAGIESIVRPFARPDWLARRRLVATNTKVPVTPARISWGTSGTLASAHQVDEIPTDGSFTVLQCDDTYEEIADSRKVDVRRIVQVLERDASGNPTKTNPDNFVDLERPYRVFFEKVELASQQRGVTQTWTTAFDTAVFQTNNLNQNVCKQTFTLQRNLK